MEGGHDISESAEATSKVLTILFDYLLKYKVKLENILLKPNLVHPGKDFLNKIESKNIAEATIKVLRSTVPASVPGIVFLSGGDDPEEITLHLNDLNKLTGAPWKLAFSFERALEGPSLKLWGGKDENIKKAQEALFNRARLNNLAREGKYVGE